MRIFWFTLLLIAGLIASQALPLLFGPLPHWAQDLRQFVTMSLLAYIMINVGRDFNLESETKKDYAIDYGVAATAAAFPWILCALYFVYVLISDFGSEGKGWSDVLLASRFAAPTSAGVLFSMLAAAGLAGTWAFNKTRVLAIFDDLDTVLFMVPLKALIVGFVWQLGGILAIITTLLYLCWRFYRRVTFLPTTWPYILLYGVGITAASEFVYKLTVDPKTAVGMHIEVLLPAFVLGCMLKEDREEFHVPGAIDGLSTEDRVGIVISGLFLFLVGYSMPLGIGPNAEVKIDMGIGELAIHVLAVTVLSNLGKMFPIFCYRKEARLKERVAVAVAMFPRGEVGAGVLAVALSLGVTGAFVTVAFLSLALNLILTGVFIVIVKRLLKSATEDAEREALKLKESEAYAPT